MTVMDYLGPAIGAGVFIVLMSFVREPHRLKVNAVLLAGSTGVYLSGGLGPWELIFPALMFFLVYRAFDSYFLVGLGWLCHSAWDVVHHLYGNPIWPFMPTSSFGCLIFDALIAVWFLAGAPGTMPAPWATNLAKS
jgi:hypothetical protein